MNMINKEPERHEIEALLPWHAAGTLNRRDADRVEQALAGDRELSRRYDLVREELAETIHLNETLGAPSARAMEKLFVKESTAAGFDGLPIRFRNAKKNRKIPSATAKMPKDRKHSDEPRLRAPVSNDSAVG